MEGLNLALSS
jgi:hypothetical protein